MQNTIIETYKARAEAAENEVARLRQELAEVRNHGEKDREEMRKVAKLYEALNEDFTSITRERDELKQKLHGT